ncbi:hypothetical protein AGDE_10748 [Angomonas deanei]|nr:hypothetical protein AGDE_10748 [Angomonas deanei]|eukprot:EPY27474.1 hypothetical protein AGDE_10748 [Angomonas deanei]
MLGGQHFTAVGRPFLNANHIFIKCIVEEQKKFRNKVSLFRTPGRRQGRWVDQAHSGTVLRVKEIELRDETKLFSNNENENENVCGFEILGEYNKYYNEPGSNHFHKSINEPLVLEQNENFKQNFVNPVFQQDDGYAVHYKKDWPAVEREDNRHTITPFPRWK